MMHGQQNIEFVKELLGDLDIDGRIILTDTLDGV
jgi:hypothetical protein